MAVDLATALSSPDVVARIDAIATLVKNPDSSRPALVALLTNPTTAVVARVWAMIALSHIGDASDGLVSRALLQCLTASEAIVRRSAIETLGLFKASTAVTQIASHLSDDQPVPETWFDDTSTPAQAARRALQSIGTPEALQLIGDVLPT